MSVTPPLFERALVQAVESMKPELKKAYEQATRKYTNDYEPILWAVADGDELTRASRDIYDSYIRIMRDLGKTPLPRDKFNAKMNNLKKPSYAKMLIATRAGWYEFDEKIIRGYARLRAAQYKVMLERENPFDTRRFGGIRV